MSGAPQEKKNRIRSTFVRLTVFEKVNLILFVATPFLAGIFDQGRGI
jgi:cell division protein FtsL